MHELTALTRLALNQHRWILSILVATVVGGQLITAMMFLADATHVDRSLAVVPSLIVLWPAGFAAFILFDFARGGDLVSPASGCSHWLLRMPIPSWKIAIVPVLLKTAWISMVWLLGALVCALASTISNHEVQLPLVAPCLALSAAAIWLLVIAWMPLHAGWQRLVLLAVFFISLYFSFGLIFVGPHIDRVAWRPLVTLAGSVLAVVLYGASVLSAVRVAGIARTSPLGLVREMSGSESLIRDSHQLTAARMFASPLRALVWHEFAKTKHWVIRSILFGVLPAVLIFGLFVPLHATTVIGVLILFAYIAGFSVCGNAESRDSLTGATLPTYLLASPLSTVQIAWTRLVIPLAVVLGIFSCVLLVFLLWSLWPSNRQTWFTWAAAQAASLDGSHSPFLTGIRLSLASVLAAGTFLIGRIVAYWWIGMSGRPWFTVLMTIVGVAAFLIPLSYFLGWFRTQSQWTEVQAALRTFLSWLPYLVVGLLALKAVAAASLTVALRRAQLASSRSIGSVFIIWLVIMLVVGSALAMLIPHRQVTFLWCVAATSLAIPLARVLAMPLTLDWNRHR